MGFYKWEDKPRQQPLTPEEQLENLIEGLTVEPFELDSPEDALPGEKPPGARRRLIAFADAFASELFGDSIVAEAANALSSSRPSEQEASTPEQGGSGQHSGSTQEEYETRDRKKTL